MSEAVQNLDIPMDGNSESMQKLQQDLGLPSDLASYQDTIYYPDTGKHFLADYAAKNPYLLWSYQWHEKNPKEFLSRLAIKSQDYKDIEFKKGTSYLVWWKNTKGWILVVSSDGNTKTLLHTTEIWKWDDDTRPYQEKLVLANADSVIGDQKIMVLELGTKEAVHKTMYTSLGERFTVSEYEFLYNELTHSYEYYLPNHSTALLSIRERDTGVNIDCNGKTLQNSNLQYFQKEIKYLLINATENRDAMKSKLWDIEPNGSIKVWDHTFTQSNKSDIDVYEYLHNDIYLPASIDTSVFDGAEYHGLEWKVKVRLDAWKFSYQSYENTPIFFNNRQELEEYLLSDAGLSQVEKDEENSDGMIPSTTLQIVHQDSKGVLTLSDKDNILTQKSPLLEWSKYYVFDMKSSDNSQQWQKGLYDVQKWTFTTVEDLKNIHDITTSTFKDEQYIVFHIDGSSNQVGYMIDKNWDIADSLSLINEWSDLYKIGITINDELRLVQNINNTKEVGLLHKDTTIDLDINEKNLESGLKVIQKTDEPAYILNQDMTKFYSIVAAENAKFTLQEGKDVVSYTDIKYVKIAWQDYMRIAITQQESLYIDNSRNVLASHEVIPKWFFDEPDRSIDIDDVTYTPLWNVDTRSWDIVALQNKEWQTQFFNLLSNDFLSTQSKTTEYSSLNSEEVQIYSSQAGLIILRNNTLFEYRWEDHFKNIVEKNIAGQDYILLTNHNQKSYLLDTGLNKLANVLDKKMWDNYYSQGEYYIATDVPAITLGSQSYKLYKDGDDFVLQNDDMWILTETTRAWGIVSFDIWNGQIINYDRKTQLLK